MTKSRHGATSRTAPFTPLQGQYLAFMHTYEGIYGCAPAEADLQRHFGVTLPSVHQMVVTPVRTELITRVAGAARSIKVQVAPGTLRALEHRHESSRDHQRFQHALVPSRQAAERTKRKSSSGVPMRIAKHVSVR